MLFLNLQTVRTPHERFERVYPAELFHGDHEDDSSRVVAPVSLSFDIRKDKDQFQLTGSVQTTVELGCSRCVEPTTVSVDAPFDLRYLPHKRLPGGDERET